MVFCETCKDEVEFTTETVRRIAKIKNTEVSYRGKEAKCVDCRNEVFVSNIRDFNLSQIDKKFFKA